MKLSIKPRITCGRAWGFLALVATPVGVAAGAQLAPPQPPIAVEQPDLAASLAAAKELRPEKEIPSPTKTTRVGVTYQVPNPDGKTVDIVQAYFPHYGGPNAFVIVDTGTGAVTQVRTDPATDGSVNVHLAPGVVTRDGVLYINCLASPGATQELIRYDPATNSLKIRAVPLPDTLLGETHPMTLSTDGMLALAGGHSGSTVTAAIVDPATGRVRDYGSQGPSHLPSASWAYSVAADDSHIYIASGKVPWHLVAVDRQTGQGKTLLTTAPVGGYLHLAQLPDGVSGYATTPEGGGERLEFWLHQGKLVPREAESDAPPWPQRPAPPHPLTYEVSLVDAEADNDGNAALWYRSRQARAAAPEDAPRDEVSERAGWTRAEFQVPTFAMDAYRLVELSDGRLFGSAGEYQGNFILNPRTGAATHLGKIALSHYATTVRDGLVYMSGYPLSPLYVYDPAKPWTANTVASGRKVVESSPASNPRLLRHLGDKDLAGTHKSYAAATGADGRVYFGGRWLREGASGGLAWYDPLTGTFGGLWRPISTYPIDYMATVGDGRYVVLSTRAVGDVLLNKPKPDEGALFTFDTTVQELSEPFPVISKARGTSLVAGVAGNQVVGWTEAPGDPARSILYCADPVARQVVWTKTLPYALPVDIGSNQKEAFDFRRGPDGHVWTFMGGALVRIDPMDATVRPLGRLAGGRIAFDGDDLWLTGRGGGIRKIAGIIPR